MARKQEESQNEWDNIEIGDQVKHAKWGVGTVLFRSGMGDSAKAIVVFPEEGQKKLMLKYAKLKKVGTTSLKSVEKLKAETAAPPPRRKTPAAPVAEEAEEEEVALELGEDEDEEIFEAEADVAGFDDEDEEFAGRDDEDSENR